MIKIINERTAPTQLLHYCFENNEWCQKWEEKKDMVNLEMVEYFQKLDAVRAQVLQKELSPIAYHAQKRMLSIKILSFYTGISKRKIKKHLMPEHFALLDRKTLEKYADAFKITVEEINNIEQ